MGWRTRPGCGRGIQPDLLPCRASLAVGFHLSSRHLSAQLSWDTQPLCWAPRGQLCLWQLGFPKGTCSASQWSMQALPMLCLGVRDLSWGQQRKERRKLTRTVAHETRCWSRSFLQVMLWASNH